VPRSPRRIYLYWLLLLAPTLAVGAGTVALLWRERARLEREAAVAQETRLAAVVATVRLTAEKADLLVGDARDALFISLRDPVSLQDWRGLRAGWSAINPLIASGFTVSPFGVLTEPEGAEGRAFQKRLARLFEELRPWRDGAARAEQAAQQVSSNAGLVPQAGTNVYLSSNNAQQYTQQRRDVQNISQAGTLAQKVAAIERGGWVPLGGGATPLRIAVWLQRNGGDDVRGAELNVAELGKRLVGALPSEPEAGEGYALLDDTGRTIGARGVTAADAEPAARVPLDPAMLPGWQVAGFMPALAASDAGHSLFFMGSMLTALFTLAILASGSLLLRQAEASATEARQKTSFVANVSHELKTPLTTIRLYAELLEQGRVRDEAQRAGFLRTIGAETQRLARLVNNVLDFSKLEQGKKLYARAPLDLCAELAALLDTHAPRVAEAGLRLERALPAGPLRVTTDRDAVAQIVLNLVENACKYAAPAAGPEPAASGEVTVTLAARDGGGAVVRVLDRGPGVPAAHAEKIFEQFHRADATLTAEQGGAGLGLSIARQLARGLGGDLRHEPREGGGAIFFLELPA
jgi:two-component system phosphate regulon sensor histidine kinase PhoR